MFCQSRMRLRNARLIASHLADVCIFYCKWLTKQMRKIEKSMGECSTRTSETSQESIKLNQFTFAKQHGSHKIFMHETVQRIKHRNDATIRDCMHTRCLSRVFVCVSRSDAISIASCSVVRCPELVSTVHLRGMISYFLFLSPLQLRFGHSGSLSVCSRAVCWFYSLKHKNGHKLNWNNFRSAFAVRWVFFFHSRIQTHQSPDTSICAALYLSLHIQMHITIISLCASICLCVENLRELCWRASRTHHVTVSAQKANIYFLAISIRIYFILELIKTSKRRTWMSAEENSLRHFFRYHICSSS